MRYALTAVAIGASLLLAWLAWRIWLPIQYDPPSNAGDINFLLGLIVTAALVMAVAAGGLIGQRAWGAYVLSAFAFLSVLPIVGVLLLASSLPSPSYTSDGSDPAIPIAFGALIFAVTVGVFAFSHGRSMHRLERAAPESHGPPRW